MGALKLLPTILSALGLCLLTTQTQAANRYWVISPGGGGDGTWNLDPVNKTWSGASNGGGTLYAWENLNPDVAYFGGSAASSLVTVSSSEANPIITGQLNFVSAGYTLTGGDITLQVSNNVLVSVGGSAGNTTINNNLNISVGTSPDRYRFQNSSTGTLTINGNIFLNEVAANRSFDIEQFNANGRIVLNGTISDNPHATNTVSLRFGENGGVNGAVYEVNGNNINGLDGGTVIKRGTVLLGNGNALGGVASKTINFGGSGVASTDTAAVLTNGAMTIANNIALGNMGNTSATYIVGGNTAHASTFSGNIISHNGMPLTLQAVEGGTVTYSGIINHQTNKMLLTGAGTKILSNSNSGAGDVEAVAGTTFFTNTGTTSGHGSGNLIVMNGAVIGGTGRLAISAANTALTVKTGGTLLGGMGDQATGTLTIAGPANFETDSIIKLVLGAEGTHSSIARTGSGAWSFQSDQLFTFTLLEGVAADTTYTNILTGLAANTIVSGWRIAPSSGVEGYFTMNGNNVNLVLTAIPEPQTALLMAGGLMVLLFRRRENRHI